MWIHEDHTSPIHRATQDDEQKKKKPHQNVKRFKFNRSTDIRRE